MNTYKVRSADPSAKRSEGPLPAVLKIQTKKIERLPIRLGELVMNRTNLQNMQTSISI